MRSNFMMTVFNMDKSSLLSFVTLCTATMGFSIITFPERAEANLKFCNNTGALVDTAIAYSEKDPPGVSTGGDRGVDVKGWWRIAPGECKVVSSMNAQNNEIYYFARSRNTKWNGNFKLCVSDSKFERGDGGYGSPSECPPGFYRTGFRPANASAKNHTVNLRVGGTL